MGEQLTLAQQRRADKKVAYEAKKADLKKQGLWKPAYKIKEANNPEKDAKQSHEQEMAEVTRLGAAIATSKTQAEAQKYRDIFRKKIDKLEAEAKVLEAEAKKFMTGVRAYEASERLQRKSFNPFTNHLKKSANESNPYPTSLDGIKRISILLLDKNIFTAPVGRIIFKQDSISSFFSHQQALDICSKMADPIARNIASKFNNQLPQDDIEKCIYQMHYLANRALDYYGGNIITFLHKLRNFQFNKKFIIKHTSTNYSVQDATIDFPTITFTAAHREKYTMVFHLQEGESEDLTKKVRVYSKSLADQIGNINKEGRFIQTLDIAKPFALLFCEFVKKRSALEFSSGVETGTCFACGRALTNSLSIKYGIGPICLQNMGGKI